MKNTELLSKRLFKGGTTIIFFSMLSVPLGYFIRMFLSRSLSIESYGLLYSVLSFIGIFTLINDLGFGYSLSYFIPKFFLKKKYDLCWYLYKYDQIIEVVTSLVIAVVLFFSSSFLAEHFFKQEKAKELLLLLSLYLVANALVSSVQKLLVGLQKEMYYSSIEFFRLGLTLLFLFFFNLFDSGNILYYATAFTLAYLLVAFGYILLVRLKFKFLVAPLKWNSKLFSAAAKYALPTFFSSSLYLIVAHTDIVLLTYFQNVTVIAVYNIIFPIVSIPGLILEPASKMVLPLVSELFEHQKDKLTLLVEYLLKVVPFIGIYFGIFMYVFPELIIKFVFGEKWVESATFNFQVTSLVYIFSLSSIFLTTVVDGLGEIKKRFKVSLFLGFLSIFLGAIGAKYFGLLGIIFSNGIIFVCSIFFFIQIIKRHVTVKLPLVLYGKVLISAYIFMFIVEHFNINPQTLAQFILTGLVYTIFMCLVGLRLQVIDFKLLRTLFR